MTHYTGRVSESGIEALRAIMNGKPYRSVFAPEVTANFEGSPHEVDQLVFWIGRHDFVVFSTLWITTNRGFDYHVYEIERSTTPGRIPYFPEGETERFSKKQSLPHLGLTSSLEVRLGQVELIEIIEACCSTTVPSDDESETIDYDYGLQLFGSEGSILLTTSFDSIRGAIEIRKGAEPELNEIVDRYRTRLVLNPRTELDKHKTA